MKIIAETKKDRKWIDKNFDLLPDGIEVDVNKAKYFKKVIKGC